MMKKFFNNFKKITEYYEFLIDKTKKLESIGITNEWLVDNYYILVENKNSIINDKKQINRNYNKKIYYVLKEILILQNYNINFDILAKNINDYQKENNCYFSYNEITLIKPYLFFLYIDRLNKLCIDEKRKVNESEKVTSIILNINDETSLSKFIDKDIHLIKSSNYIFEINNQLKELGTKSYKILRELTEILQKNNIGLKNILNTEYQSRIENTVLISNIIESIKRINDIDYEIMLQSICECEKILFKDKIYDEMTIESKECYRNQIIKLAKKKNLKEYQLANNIYINSKNENKHIGFYLFKEPNTKIRMYAYTLTITILTLFSCLFLSKYFINNRIIAFIILLIPISQIYIQTINQLLMSFIRPKPIFKMDFQKGIPSNEATMVVIPTIISDTNKIKKLFETLETYYLVNKTKNLYFTLLGDVKASQKQVCDYDEEIINYGLKCVNELNDKYNGEIFNFIYRKRIYNPKEDCYLGYERKRGALLHFNQLLLNKMPISEQKKYFNVHTFKDFNIDIKYVITLDVDTKLVLNTALNLVGAMAHPLNKPILNSIGTKVVKGYGIMQPRVSVDIESTSKSKYSQIFGSIGGYDSYNAIFPNVYQDTFNEGSFVGKGIYDLKVFDKILGNLFPENLILSHDLLEGNYLRCAYVTDIELIDDFPSKFLSDTSRQHRWARGDTQIIGWLKPWIKNKNNKLIKNPINLLGKWKIFDNIARMFLYPSLLSIIILSIIFDTRNAVYWILLVYFEISLLIIFHIKKAIYLKKQNHLVIHYRNLTNGIKALFIKSYITFASIPFYTKLYMDAFFRTIYRLLISKKNLLNWITAEDAEKTSKSSLGNYLFNFLFNIILSVLLLILAIIKGNILIFVTALIFLSAPFILHKISTSLIINNNELSDIEKDKIKDDALKIWNFFCDNLNEEYNYLIPDNYQENRENKIVERTSPTNIGFSLTSIITAHSLGFITLEEAIILIDKIITSIESLEKWNGHLFNWYNIRTKEKIQPYFVSTVDSGNLVASLIVTKEFLKDFKYDKLYERVEKIINQTNFKKLYTKTNVFSIGYDLNEEKISSYNYNKFASESRLTSYVAIAKGDAPSKHWFSLDKSLTTFNHQKGLISWTGTSFEYYMPLLFLKNYQNTLFDESYNFAHMCQKKYIEKINNNLPWGISESAYDELDNSENYRYKSFSTPYLKAKEIKDERIVLSPYASLMAMNLYPKDIFDNMMKFKNLSMYGKYGYYEAYDYETKKPVRAYFSHHLGMSLAGIGNYLTGVIQNYFHNDIKVKMFDILLKEKVQLRANIDIKIAEYKKYDYNKEKIENDIRSFNYISEMPEISVLSNKKYCLLMNDRGNGFSRYRTLQLNRYRKITEQDQGMFLYIKDIKTNKIWSNTYAPTNNRPDKYDVIFASDKIKYIRTDDTITTTTEIVVTKDNHAEIRKITFQNDGEKEKILELTSYIEPIICENTDDISHRVFNNMFIKSEYDESTNSLISIRKSRSENRNNYMINRLLVLNPLINYQYETDRAYFIGRNNTVENPNALNKNLTNKAGFNLEPIMSLRNRIKIEPNEKEVVYLIMGYGKSKEQLFETIKAYDNKNKIKKAFDVASLMNVINTKNLNITGNDMRTYNIMLNYLYQTTRITISEERKELLRKNALTKSSLWKFGISGDRPVILVDINDVSDISFVLEILKAFEYYKNISIFVDIVIINSENDDYAKLIKNEIDNEVYRMYTVNNFSHTPGIIKVINARELSNDEKSLFNIVPRLRFILNDHKSLKEKIEDLQKNNSINEFVQPKYMKYLPNNDLDLEFKTSYGGFNSDGNEYIVTNPDTPTPWSNVISNDDMGTIITNNGCGFTYCYNSSEFKISSWTNDTVCNDKSEGIKIDGCMFDPTLCRHGFGYSILSSETNNLKINLTEFIAKTDTTKIYILDLTNKENVNKKHKISFWINPTLGSAEEKTSRHILTEYMKDKNYLKMRNVYNINYSDVVVYMSSSENIISTIDDRILIKEITVEVELESKSEKQIVFTLSCSKDEQYTNKFNNINNALKELNIVKQKWNETLKTITIKTPDKSFDNMMNGWYLYQALSSRILAKTGFYQVSGAFGYRDQLQDTMNIVSIKPDLTKKQIITNAHHQFKNGEVLHWWHEANHFGLRSRYKDDYLWLIYAVCEYIESTNDYDILNELVPFINGEELKENEVEKGIIFNYTEEKDTLFNHCLSALNLSMNQLGSHKLPLMGGGDWNDGMNKVGIKGKGESVWLGFFLYNIIDRFTNVISNYNSKFDLSQYKNFNNELKNSLNEFAWDKDYYLRAYFDNNDPLGSHLNDECKIDLISQSFSIISGVASKEREELVINSVEKYLVDNKANIIKLLTPPFENSKNDPGYIMKYPKGVRENGGQYTHATAWYLLALIKSQKYDRAYKYYQMINPINRTNTNDKVNIYKDEPYVIAADIYSEDNLGRGGWTWYTGSAGWFYKVGLKLIGFEKHGEILDITPKMPKEWNNFSINYKYKDTLYEINIAKGKCIKKLLDGKETDKIKLVNDKKIHKIDIMIKEVEDVKI